jgi:hypothetical protein
LQLRKGDKAAEEDDAPYGYGFFHFVFATGAMYFAMLLVLVVTCIYFTV